MNLGGYDGFTTHISSFFQCSLALKVATVFYAILYYALFPPDIVNVFNKIT